MTQEVKDNKLLNEIENVITDFDYYTEDVKTIAEKLYSLQCDVSVTFDEWREDNYLGGRDEQGRLVENTWHTFDEHTKMMNEPNFNPQLKSTKELFDYFISHIYKNK